MRSAGFSIVELMISMTMLLVAMAAVYGVLQIGQIQRSTVIKTTSASRGARVALSFLRRDAINAGLKYHRVGGLVRDDFLNSLMGLPADSDDDYDLLTGIFGGNNIYGNNLDTFARTDLVGFVSRDLDFNNGQPIEYDSAQKVANRIEINTSNGAAAVAGKYDLFLLETGTTQVVGMVTNSVGSDPNVFKMQPNDPLSLNQKANGTGNDQNLLVVNNGKGTIKKIKFITYSVNAEGVFVRTIYGNKTGATDAEQIDTQELLTGVRDMQVRYLLADGTTSDDPSNGNNGRLNQALMNNVVQIEVTLTLVPLDDDGIQTGGVPLVFKETISTRNLRYDIG